MIASFMQPVANYYNPKPATKISHPCGMRSCTRPQCVLATRDGAFFTASCSTGSAQFEIAGSIDVPVIACQWADDGDVCAVATSIPSIVLLTKEFDVVGECEAG